MNFKAPKFTIACIVGLTLGALSVADAQQNARYDPVNDTIHIEPSNSESDAVQFDGRNSTARVRGSGTSQPCQADQPNCVRGPGAPR